jgi:hypothetical protein
MKKKLILALVVVAVAAALIAGPSLLAGINKGTQAAGPGNPASKSSAAETDSTVRQKRSSENPASYIETRGRNAGHEDVVPRRRGQTLTSRSRLGIVKTGQLIAEWIRQNGRRYSLSLSTAPISERHRRGPWPSAHSLNLHLGRVGV